MTDNKLRVGLPSHVAYAKAGTFTPVYFGDGDTRGNLRALFKNEVDASNYVSLKDEHRQWEYQIEAENREMRERLKNMETTLKGCLERLT